MPKDAQDYPGPLPAQSDYRKRWPITNTGHAMESQVAAEKAAMTHLIQYEGYTPAQAAGIVGNLVVESAGLNPDMGGPPEKSNAYGLAQWGGDRIQNLMDWAAQHEMDVGDLDTQVGFLVHELRDGVDTRNAEALIRGSNDVLGATDGYLAAERPSGYNSSHPERSSNHAQRLREAQRLYDTYSYLDQPVQGNLQKGENPGLPAASVQAADDRLFNVLIPKYIDPKLEPVARSLLGIGPLMANGGKKHAR